jgi:hypothetical protein
MLIEYTIQARNKPNTDFVCKHSGIPEEHGESMFNRTFNPEIRTDLLSQDLNLAISVARHAENIRFQ